MPKCTKVSDAKLRERKILLPKKLLIFRIDRKFARQLNKVGEELEEVSTRMTIGHSERIDNILRKRIS